MALDSIMIVDNGKVTPEHFEMPLRFALERYEEELKAQNPPTKNKTPKK